MSILVQVKYDVDATLREKSGGVYSDFRHFYSEFHLYVRNLIYRMGVENDLDDLVQQTFIAAWRKIESFKNLASLKTWLTRIAINVVYDYFRKESRRGRPVEKELSAPALFGKSYENKQVVTKALRKLSLEHRTIIILSILEGNSLQEVSVILDIPLGTVKSRLNRAKSALQEELESLGVKYGE